MIGNNNIKEEVLLIRFAPLMCKTCETSSLSYVSLEKMCETKYNNLVIK